MSALQGSDRAKPEPDNQYGYMQENLFITPAAITRNGIRENTMSF
jgi:hypothetical protein